MEQRWVKEKQEERGRDEEREKQPNFFGKNIFSTGWCFWPVLNVPLVPVRSTGTKYSDGIGQETGTNQGYRPVLMSNFLAVFSFFSLEQTLKNRYTVSGASFVQSLH